MITNCDSENLSEFCNYFVDEYSLESAFALGKLLTYYKMAASNLSVNVSPTSITLSWTANGTTSSLQNNRFDLVFFDENNSVILSIDNITSPSYTLSDVEVNSVHNNDATFKVMVVSYQTSSPTTGGYYSEVLSVPQPHAYGWNTWIRFTKPLPRIERSSSNTLSICSANDQAVIKNNIRKHT